MTSLQQWLKKHRRPRSALYMPTELPQKCENRRTMSWVQSSSSQKLQQEDADPVQQPPVRASLDCGLAIPARHTSKHYKLDPELQAKVDRAVSSERIRLLSQRVQRQSMHPSCSCQTSTTTSIPERELHHHHRHYSQYPHHHPQQQEYHNNYLYHHSSQSPPPPPPPHHFST